MSPDVGLAARLPYLAFDTLGRARDGFVRRSNSGCTLRLRHGFAPLQVYLGRRGYLVPRSGAADGPGSAVPR
jgi:hypothetical protein